MQPCLGKVGEALVPPLGALLASVDLPDEFIGEGGNDVLFKGSAEGVEFKA